jgi:hypothetical protein
MKNTTIELPSEGDEPDVVYQKMGRMVGETVKWTTTDQTTELYITAGFASSDKPGNRDKGN